MWGISLFYKVPIALLKWSTPQFLLSKIRENTQHIGSTKEVRLLLFYFLSYYFFPSFECHDFPDKYSKSLLPKSTLLVLPVLHSPCLCQAQLNFWFVFLFLQHSFTAPMWIKLVQVLHSFPRTVGKNSSVVSSALGWCFMGTVSYCFSNCGASMGLLDTFQDFFIFHIICFCYLGTASSFSWTAVNFTRVISIF